MIEFKAECGHTVRAKDEDAGGSVRCSYCGRTANVPEDTGNDLDFLFSDVEQPVDAAVRGRTRRKKKRARVQRPSGSFSPFSVVLRMCYAALLITIVIVVGKKFVLPLFQEGGLTTRISQETRKAPRKGDKERKPRKTVPAKLGLIDRSQVSSLYVSSTPPGAEIFCLEASKAPPEGRIYRLHGVNQFRGNAPSSRLADGTYVVEVALPWVDDDLKAYPKYKEFRRAIEDASYEVRCRVVEDYFLPDQADLVFVDEDDSNEQIYIVRQYRDVNVRQLHPRGIRALFLPKLAKTPNGGFSVEQLLNENYIPSEHGYAFKRNSVESELDYYGVPRKDWRFLVEALSRIGAISYMMPDGRIRLFKIDINDGTPKVRVIREATP